MARGQAQLDRHLFTLEEYERMVESGGFDADARIELIRGEIVDMAPIGIRHAACVARLTALLVRKAGDSAVVWSQNPFSIPGHSRPEPDVALLRWRDDYYASKGPTPDDAVLIVEVSDTTLKYDRAVKGPLYGEAGIPEYWIINLQENTVEIYSNPEGGVYKQMRHARRGDSLALPPKLGGSILVEDFLG